MEMSYWPFFSSEHSAPFKNDHPRSPSQMPITFGQQVKHRISCRFPQRPTAPSINIVRQRRANSYKKGCVSHASWMPTPLRIANDTFTFGTLSVLPFYIFMVVAPRSKITEKVMGSSIPYVVLGIVYAYLLFLSLTPDTIRLVFGTKYLLPELPGIAKLFSSKMTLASAWMHLLAVDLFAARQVYFDGRRNDVETRHSVCLCLLCCPIGIFSHFITKAMTNKGETRGTKTQINEIPID